MNHMEKVKAMYKVFDRAIKLAENKSHDYAKDDDSLSNLRMAENIGLTPEHGIMIRLTDKYSRLCEFYKKGNLQVNDEKIEDTVIDMINYLALLIIMRGED